MGIHQTKERPEFLSKMLATYRSSEVADNTNERKDDETRNFLMRRNNVLLQARRAHTRRWASMLHVTRLCRRGRTPRLRREARRRWKRECLCTRTSAGSWTTSTRCSSVGRTPTTCACQPRAQHARCRPSRAADTGAPAIAATFLRPAAGVAAAKRKSRASARPAARARGRTSGTGALQRGSAQRAAFAY